ncbi:hypothetical protein ACH4TS_31100 [Streptomyces albidoflavus]
MTAPSDDAARPVPVRVVLPAEPVLAQPAPSAGPVKRVVREHHEECDEELYEGGDYTC